MGPIVSVMTGPPRQADRLGVSGPTTYTVSRTDPPARLVGGRARRLRSSRTPGDLPGDAQARLRRSPAHDLLADLGLEPGQAQPPGPRGRHRPGRAPRSA